MVSLPLHEIQILEIHENIGFTFVEQPVDVLLGLWTGSGIHLAHEVHDSHSVLLFVFYI
jgi:hypothetical protein